MAKLAASSAMQCRCAESFDRGGDPDLLVFGEAHNFCVALIAVDPDMIGGWAIARGLNGYFYPELVESREVHQFIDEHV